MLGYYEISEKSLNFIELLPLPNENFASTSKNILKNRNRTLPRSALSQMKTRVCLKYVVNDLGPIYVVSM